MNICMFFIDICVMRRCIHFFLLYWSSHNRQQFAFQKLYDKSNLITSRGKNGYYYIYSEIHIVCVFNFFFSSFAFLYVCLELIVDSIVVDKFWMSSNAVSLPLVVMLTPVVLHPIRDDPMETEDIWIHSIREHELELKAILHAVLAVDRHNRHHHRL